jgi:alkanesulfonate monooxygenase SsuD/methylene tetrahydromethanopterin reductase-like flavin-dependent oxidoreductase (luciferase family)
MDEYLRCLEALWTQDPVEFSGEFYVVPRSHVGPRPVQRPHPPVLLGGTAAPALRRAGRLAQGWIAGSTHDRAQLGAAIETVRGGARDAGRDPDALQIVVRLAREPALDELVALRAQGVTEVFLDLNLSPRVDVDNAERVLEAFAPG